MSDPIDSNDEPITESAVRANLAKVRALSARHAVVADMLERLLDASEARSKAPPGVRPIGSSLTSVRRTLTTLKAKALALLRGAGNDNA